MEKVREALRSSDVEVSPDVPFRELQGFSSVDILVIYDLIVREYGVTIELDEFLKINTFRELFELVMRKVSSPPQNKES